ncbi:enhanced entry virulence factor RtxA [Legionella pneumophila]
MLVESVIGIVRAVNGLLEKVNAQGQASLVKSGARLQEGDVLTLLSGEAYIQFIHGFPEALALGKPVNLYGVSPALQYGVEELNEQLVQEALAKGIDPSVILDVLGSAAAGAEAVGSGGDAFIIDPLFGFGQVTAGYPTGPISFAYEADTQHLFWYVPEETGAIAESELTTEPESIPQIPQFTTNQAVLTVFEDALPSGIPDSAGQARMASSFLSTLLTSSPDVAASFAFNTNLSVLPTLKSGGIELDYNLSADKRTLTASIPGGAAIMQFELTADGRLTQTLMDSIDHPTTDSDDGEWMRLDLSPLIDVTFTRASDGTVLESRTLPANAVVAGIQDDVPIARAQLTNNEILLDETVGVKVGDADAANDDFNPTTTADPFNNAYGIPTGLVQNANLLDTSTSEMGGDYKNATMTHLLKITDAVSGLQTTNGTPINLFLESNGDITGRAGDIGAPALFAIRMNPNTGAISVAQYGPIKQFDTNSHDEAVDLTGRISAVVTAKDSDGDVSNVEIPIGQLIIFEDDGPSIVVSGATQTLTVDESALATNDTQSFAGLFTPSFGADGAAAANALTYSLGVSANGAASGVLDTASGNQVFLFLENGIVVGREGSDALDAATGDVVFNISVDGSGNVTLDQVRAVVHDNPLDPDESTGPTQLSAANLVTLTAIATDKDGDSASATANIGLSFNFEDDGPSIVVSGATQTLTVDESALATNDTQSFAGLFTPSFGADGAAAANALSYSLGVSANGAASGVLDTASGNQVFLFLENGIVVGREGSDALDAATGDVVFNISVDGSGNVTLDQVRAVVHDNPLDPDESTGPTQLSAANLVTLTAIATDKDGDSASATANIGLSFNFEDDGPSIVVSGATQTLTVDESVLTTNDTQSFAGLFTPSFGADGAAAANALSYSLGVSANGAASGVLDTASGNQVFLFLENGIVVGREGSDALDAATGDVVFNISVDGSGNVTLDQVRAVVHDNPNDPNESTEPTQLSAANLVTLTAIATDKDGDSASATANIGLSFNFEDDGPSIVVSGATQTLTVDESALATNDTQSFAGLFTPSFGADGAAAAAANALTYSLGVSANGAASGVLDTASGNQVFLFLENGIVVGREGSDALDAATGDVVFNISVDGSGNVTLDQVRAVVHDNPLDPDESTGPTQLSAANLVTLTAIATDKDGDSASAAANIGLSFNFEDDGPSIVVSGATQTLTVDESVLATNDTQSFAGLFTPSFGADGAAAANALSYSLGVSVNGAASGVLDTASGNQVFLFLENGIVVGREGSDALDAATGDVVFNISVDGSGNVTLDQVRAVVHDNPLDPDESTGPTQLSAANLVTLTAIATDKDGDSASATANIGLSFNFEDDGPSIVVSGATQTLTVDESVLTTNDTQSFAGLFTPSFGADGAAAANALSYSLGVSANGAASGVLDTASGNQVFLFLENGIVVGREGSDALDAATGDVVFNISVDGSGNVTLDQVRAVVHDNPLDPDESTGPTQLSAANLVTLTAIATDKDGDSASATANIGLSFNFEDDGPSIVVSGATQTLTVDESVLATNDTQSFAGLFTPSFGADGAAAANALSYSLGVSANGAASGVLDTASGNQVFLFLENGIVVGREGSDALDAATGDVVFNISVDGSGNVTLDQVRAVVHDNPLDPDESTGPTQLSAANLVTLTAIATDKDGDSASATANIGLSFNFEDDGPSIVVSGATQTLTVDESVLTTNDTQSFAGLFTPSFGADGAAAANALSYSLGVSANGAASGVLDTASGNQVFLFLENGIVVGREGSDALDAATGDVVFNISVDGSGNVTLDQVRAVVHDNPLDPDESTGPTQLSAANLVTLTAIATDKDGDSASATANIGLSFNFEDDGPSIVVSGATQTLTVDESVLATNDTQSFAGLFTPSFGADGAAAANALSYSLGVSANGAASGVLDTASGNQVFLFLENGIVVGREGSDALDAATGDVVFNISVDGSGNVTLDQVRAVVHDNPLDPDESTGPTQLSAANLVTLTAIATDKDGDSASATANIGLSFNFEDDGPSIVVSGATQTLTVDESVLTTNDTQSFAGLFTPSFGADGAAAANALSYSLGVSANGAASGVLDAASGNQVFLFLENGIVVGREGSDALDAATGDVVFNISVDGSGNVTLDQVRAVVHDNPLDPDESTGPTQLSAANLVTLTAIATDKDGDSASATANIGLSFNFEDDGPSIVVSGATQTLTVDESVLATNDTQSFAGLFTPSFGADGAAAANALSYSLGVSANGAASGVLDTASGNQVFLFLENGIVVGREGSDALDAATGDVVFNISVDGSGNVTLDQVRAVVHDNPLDPDESTGPTQLSAANLVTLTAIATDKDGDSASATANIGLSFNFEDDGPVASTNKLTGVVDEDGLTGGIAGGVGDVAGQAVAASGNVATLFQSGADAPLTYSLNANTSGLPALSSGGVALTYAVSGNTLTASAGSTQVFTFTLNANGNYSFTLLAKLDHPAGADENDITINLGSVIRATDSDGDTVTAAADGLVITVDDDTPIASANKLTGVVDEDGLTGGIAGGVGDVAGQAVAASGNVATLFQSGADAPLTYSLNANTSGLPALSSGGVALTYAVSGNTLTASAGSTQVFTFTLNANGNYSFTLLAKLDHPAGADENDITINLGSVIRATDSDGDTVTAAADGLVITVDDDTPIASANKLTGVVDEDGLTGGIAGGVGDVAGQAVAASGNVATLFQSGADAPLTYSLNASTSGLPALSSGGVALTYAVSGNTLTASAGSTQVFTFTLNANGNYSFTLLAKLDHPAGADENDITINLGSVIRATDSDGDTVTAAADGLVITVDDDTPIASANKLTGVVDEDGLTGGIAGGVGDVAGQAVAASGNVATLFQSGADAPLTYSLNANTSGLPALSSGGVALTYAVSGNTLTASAGSTQVFTFTLNANGNYSFTLLAKLDHPAGADENDITINLGSVIRATDSDGDTVTAAADGLVITVDDDTPIASANKLTGVVDEDGLTGGIAGGVGDVAGQAVAASGNVATLFQSGADAPLTYSLNANTSGLPALSSGGVALTYAVSGNTLTASAGSTQVFTFTLNANGNYSFTLLAKLDHPAGADENDITINLGSVIRATDSDGDTVTAAADGLVITVDDDTPVAITPEEGFVSNKAGVVKVFNLDLDSNIGNNVGADQPGSIRFINVVDGQQAQGIIDGELVNLTTVNGQLIKLYISNDGMIITGSTATSEAAVNSGNTVFKVTMLPDNDYNLANDKYSVEMFGKIGVINTVNFSDLAGDSPAGNVNFKIISDQDFPGYEVLITPKDRVNPDDTVGGTVNSSSTDISISNQWIEQGSGDSEILRLDYGQFAIVNNKFNIEKHFIVNGASFEIHQIQGGPSNRASINVKAFDADDDNQLNDDPLDAITRIVIFTSSGGVETVIADVTSDTSFGGMTFDFQGTNGVNITGLDDGYRVRAYTADGYNRLEIDNISSTPFSIGGLGIQSIIDTEKEVKMTYDVRLTDSDGDSVDSSFDVNIAPSLLKVGENINDTSSSNVPHTVGNDVGVIDGGRGADVLVGDVGGVKDVRIAFVLDESGSMSQNFGGSTRMDVLKQVMTDVLTELGNTPNANITVHLVKFASIVNGTGTFNITGGELQNALDFISGLQIQQGNLAGTNYEAALGQTALWFNSLTGTADVQQTLFLTDGAPTLYMDGNSTDYTNINAVYGHGNQTEEVLWENLFGEHTGNQATVDLFNHLNESNSRDLDGTQSYSVDTDGDGDFETVSVNARSSGTTQSTSDLVRSTADNVNEVQALQAHGSLRAVSIANNVSVYLQDIDSTGQPYVASSPGLLQDILNELNPFNSLNPVGSDIIQGNEADDLIFGDTLFTDKLAEDEGLNLRKGSGWDVFEELEASHGWSRQDTLNYIASHADELGKETVLSNGSTRSGGHDTISGGQGNDQIYGQEGNDIIDGGAGNDIIVGGTGNDTLTGGSGADQFVLFRGHGSNDPDTAPTDTITDFEANIDKIVINGIGINITGVTVSPPDVNNIYAITVNYSGGTAEHFKVKLDNSGSLSGSVVITGNTATIDGTIVGAVLYLDLNANNQEDEGERLGITDQYGHVEWVVDLSKFDVNGDGQYVIGEARAVQTGGFDIDTGLSYEINLYGPVGSAVISPLTSLLQAQLEAGMDYETANAALVARLGLPEGTQIISFNPITGSGEVLAQNAGVMTAAIQFSEIAAIHYSTDEAHVSFAVFEAISKALLELPEGVVADFGDEGFLQSIANYLGLDALVTSDMIDYMATSQKALEASILTLAPGEDALTAISKIQHVTQGIYAQAIEMALIGYLPLDALKNMSAVLKAYADGDITDEQLNSFEDKLSAVIVNWEDNNVTDASHQATLQTERTVDDSSVKSEANHEMAQEVNAVINDFMDEHNISLYYYDQQAQMPQEAQEEQQLTEDQAEETVMHDDVVQDLLLDDHSLTMLANNPQLNGGNGNDVLHGTTGNDFIRGGQGNDTMTGGGGVDTFFWLSGDDDGGVDTITDFKANPVDQSSDASVLNLSDLLSDADLETNSLDNYLNVSTTEEGDTAIKVDPNGNGNFDAPAQTIILEDVDLTAVFATNNSHDIVNQMIANGNLIVEQ